MSVKQNVSGISRTKIIFTFSVQDEVILSKTRFLFDSKLTHKRNTFARLRPFCSTTVTSLVRNYDNRVFVGSGGLQ